MNKDYLNQQVREYLSQAEGLGYESKINLLINLIEKITILDRGTIVFTKKDLTLIVSGAKNMVSSLPVPIKLSNSELDYSEIPHFCMVMATIDYLTLRDSLKKQIEVEKK